jgi:hypothetical protein
MPSACLNLASLRLRRRHGVSLYYRQHTSSKLATSASEHDLSTTIVWGAIVVVHRTGYASSVRAGRECLSLSMGVITGTVGDHILRRFQT